MPAIQGPVQGLPCDHTETYMAKPYPGAPWQINDNSGKKVDASFTQLLHSELGNESHLDRLTIFLARPNRMKGAVSTFRSLAPPLFHFIVLGSLFLPDPQSLGSAYPWWSADAYLPDVFRKQSSGQG